MPTLPTLLAILEQCQVKELKNGQILSFYGVLFYDYFIISFAGAYLYFILL